MAPYTYNPLKEARATRFVRLLPGTAGGIQCQLFRASLDDHTEYIALSYAWGSVRKDETITCNGRSLQVTSSLWTALRRLRLPDTPRVFWIDAICINQEDTLERNNQVSLITEIFQRAQRLYIWLGPGDSYSSAAVGITKQFAAAQEELMTVGRLQYVHVKLEEWVAFAKLLQRSWFERLWVIQELAMGLQLSSDSGPLFLCGVHRFGLEVLKLACEWCNQLSFDPEDSAIDATIMRDVQNGIKRFLVLCEMTRHSNPEEVRKGLWRHWLLSKVAATREKKATDPRDRLFALYGFLRDGNEPVVIADYGKSVTTVFQEFARDYILHAKCLDVLSEVEEPALRAFRNFPSWAPNWSIETARLPLLRQAEILGTQRSRKFSGIACGSFDPCIHSVREDVILIDGICFDEVKWVSEVLSPENLAHTEDRPSMLLDIWKVAQFLEPYPSRAPAIEAFYKTLICGREDEDRHADNFVAFWKSLNTSDDSDMAEFCINSPEMIKLLCHRPAGAEVVAQMHESRFALEKLKLEAQDDGAVKDDALFTPLEIQTTLRYADALKGGRQFLRNANGRRYGDLLRETALRRVFFTTQRGYMGLGVAGAMAGDLITILTGGKIPYVLRKSTLPERRHTPKAPKSPYSPYKTQSLVASLVGEAYVHGIMHGEAVEREWDLEWDRIALV